MIIELCPYCEGIHTFSVGYDEYQCFDCDMTWTKEEEVLEEENLCSRCKRNEAESHHQCPYQSDMNGDRDFTCDCCNDCYSNCLGDI